MNNEQGVGMEILKEITIGVSYYPEHWGRDCWEADVADIADMGAQVIRAAESAWVNMEPSDGVFDFDWLDDFIDLASRHNIRIVLGTPTWAAPIWLTKSHPEVIRINADGSRGGHGRVYCFRSKAFRFYSQRIAEAMAQRYGRDKRVVGWQIDNELCGVPCHCHECRHGFRVWLENKYGSIDALNKAWGTWFRSRTYRSFEEVDPPSDAIGNVLTAQILDFYRFISWSTVDYANMQAEAIRKHSVNQFISHNSLAMHHELSLYDLFKDLDLAAWDAYPNVDDDYVHILKGHDLCRSAKHDNFWILEQKNGYINYSTYNLAIRPGLVRAWTYLDIARGANGVVYYRYRANRWGNEQNPNGILRHDSSKRRAWYEIQQLIRELAPAGDVMGQTKVYAPVAIIHSYDELWSSLAKNQYSNYDCHKLEDEFYRALLSMGIVVDLVHPEDDLSPYKVVIAPNLMLISEKIAGSLSDYTASGGLVIFNIRSGQRDMHNAMTDKTWPGLLRKLCGVTIDEFEAFPPGKGNKVLYKDREYPASWWADIITAETACTEAVYTEQFYQGKAAITVNTFGKGRAVYFGAAGCADLVADYLRALLLGAGLQPLCLPDRTFVIERKNKTASFTFILNMGEVPQELDPGIRGTDILAGREVAGSITIEPLEILIVQDGKPA